MQTIKSSESPPAGIDRSIPQQQPSPQAQIAVSQKKPWTDTDTSFLGSDSTFEQQSLHASGIEQLAASDDPTVAEVTQQISLLRHSITTAEQRIAAQRQSFHPEQMLQMEAIPSSFTLQVIRAAYSKCTQRVKGPKCAVLIEHRAWITASPVPSRHRICRL